MGVFLWVDYIWGGSNRCGIWGRFCCSWLEFDGRDEFVNRLGYIQNHGRNQVSILIECERYSGMPRPSRNYNIGDVVVEHGRYCRIPEIMKPKVWQVC